jgi:hypothetical protein
MASSQKIFRVLCIDGGGMRGIYSAAYLDILLSHYANTRGVSSLDLGRGFDLVAGTSTGGILACAAAAGIPMKEVTKLYRQHGPAIFPAKVPTGLLGLIGQYALRPGIVKRGEAALRDALAETLGGETVRQLWDRRGIALAVPAVQMGHHAPWVFKTPHLPNSKHRDDGYSLVDVCLATSAAPIYRSLAWVPNHVGEGGLAFTDGGLWANNPVLVGLIDALHLTKPGDRIEIFCLGTCPPPTGDQIPKSATNWGFHEWKVGANVPVVAISAQQYAYDYMANFILPHTGREGKVVRFPHADVPASILAHLDLDETSEKAMDALVTQAQADVQRALSIAGQADSEDGRLINNLLLSIPEGQETAHA